MEERERLAARRWLTRVSIGRDADGGDVEWWDRLREEREEFALGREEEGEEAAMVIAIGWCRRYVDVVVVEVSAKQ